MATLAGEAAIRIVPSLAGFKPEADRRLKAMRFEPINVNINPGFKKADVEMAAWRKRQELNAVNVPVKADFQAFKRDLTTVEHIFKKSALQQAYKIQIKVIGLDALPALAYAAGSAASGLSALADAALIIPGLLGGALASVGALAVGLHGVKDAFTAFTADQKSAEKGTNDTAKANRDIARSYKDYGSAVRDTMRNIQDLNAENRRSSLNVADAVLSVQEAADKLRAGGQASITELKRDQLGYLQAIDHLSEVQVKAQRTSEDAVKANTEGVAGADQVVSALDRIADATDALNKKGNAADTFSTALAKMSPNAQTAIKSVLSFKEEWKDLTASVQENLFANVGKEIEDLGKVALPGLKVGLSGVATGLNSVFTGLAESLGLKKNQTFMDRIFGNTEGGLKNFSKAVNPLTTGLLRLVKGSSDFLPRLGAAGEKVFTRFDAWTEKISNNGDLMKWIDTGFKAVSSLGNAAINIASAFQSVGTAFDLASGTTGGFIGTLERASKGLADLLKSPKGQAGLADYFKQARDFISDIVGALKKMAPFLATVRDTAREFSKEFFAIAGGLLKTAAYIERNTGLLGGLLKTYLVFKTVKPIVDGLTTSWKNYEKVVNATASANSPFRNLAGIQNASNGLAKLRGEAVLAAAAISKVDGPKIVSAGSEGLSKLSVDRTLPPELTAAQRAAYAANQSVGTPMDPAVAKSIYAYQTALVDAAHAQDDMAKSAGKVTQPVEAVGTNAGKAAPEVDKVAAATKTAGTTAATASTGIRNSASALGSVGLQAPGVTEKMKSVSSEFATASEKVGAKGGIGLLGRLGGLGAAMGPGLALAAGITLITTLTTTLAQAHEKAAQKAKDQTTALQNLATTLNTTSGAFNAETLNTSLAQFQDGIPIKNLDNADKFNVLGALKNIGANPREAVSQAADPTKGAEFDKAQGDRVKQLTDDLSNSDFYKTNKSKFDAYGLTAQDLIEANLSESSPAFKKVQDAIANPKFVQAGRSSVKVPLPDLGDVANSLPNRDLFAASQGLQGLREETSKQGAANLNVAKERSGVRRLAGPGLALEEFAPDENALVLNVDGSANIQINRNPSKEQRDKLSEQGVTVSDTDNGGNGVYTVTVPADKANEWLPEVTTGTNAGTNFVGGHARGGLIGGVGGPTSDSNLAMVSRGEHIAKAAAVDHYGVGLFDDLNNMRIPKSAVKGFKVGGFPFPLGPAPEVPLPDPTSGIGGLMLPGATSVPGAPGAAPNLGRDFLGSIFGVKLPPAPGKTVGGGNVLPGFHDDGSGTIVPDAPVAAPNAPAVPATSTPAASAAGSITDPGLTAPGTTGFTDSASAIAGLPAVPADSNTLPTFGPPPGPDAGAGSPQAAVPSAPIYTVGQNPFTGASELGMSGPTADRINAFAQSVAGTTPYSWGGFSTEGMDCSGLAAAVANIATTGDPFTGGRFSTANELQELTNRGFATGAGGPGELTIGWDGGHTGITLPNGQHIDAQNEKNGIVLGAGSRGATGFPNVMHLALPDSTQSSQLAASLPGGGAQSLLGGLGIAGGKQKQSPLEFMKDLAGNVGGTLASTGLSFLDGITGINFSGMAGLAQQTANGLLGSSLFGPGGETDLTKDADKLMQDYQNGGAGLSAGAQSLLGSQGFGTDKYTSASNSGLSAPGQKGGEAYRPLVKAALQQLGPQYNITNEKAWEDALVAQIGSESGGDPASLNTADSNGKGGTQTVSGLLNFLGSTYDAHNITGLPSSNPTGQIAAAIDYVTKKYGVDADGAPRQIGRGVGFAGGGSPMAGPAWLSKGEYRTSAAATKYYGPELFNSLNSMSIPGFDSGGMVGDSPSFWDQLKGGTGKALEILGQGYDWVESAGGRLPKGPSVIHGQRVEAPLQGGIVTPGSIIPKLAEIGVPLGVNGGKSAATRLAQSLNPNWMGQQFARNAPDFRAGAADAVKNGYTAPDGKSFSEMMTGLTGASRNPGELTVDQSRALFNHGRDLTAQANNAAPTTTDFFRGMGLPDEVLEGALSSGSLQLPMSSFTRTAEGAGGFAAGANQNPLSILLRPGAQGVHNLPQSGIDGGIGESLFGGRFGIQDFTKGVGRNPSQLVIEHQGLAGMLPGFAEGGSIDRAALGAPPGGSGSPYGPAIQELASYGGGQLAAHLPGFAKGGLIQGAGNGTSDSIPMRGSNGEFMMSANAVRKIGVSNLGAMNAPGFALGGLPFMEGAQIQPPHPSFSSAPAKEMTPGGPNTSGAGPAPAPTPAPAAPMAPPSGPKLATPGIGAAGVPSTGGALGPGATAPAPDPGATPQIGDAQSAIGGIAGAIGSAGSGVGNSQPGADPSNAGDPRATLGAAPTSTDHNLPAISQGIKGAASQIGAIGAAAAGATGMAPGAGVAIQGAADIGGQVASNVANIFSSLLVGTATAGSTASASGTPLVAARPQSSGVRQMVQEKNHYGDVNVTSFDDLKRTQDRLDAQQQLPYIGKYA